VSWFAASTRPVRLAWPESTTVTRAALGSRLIIWGAGLAALAVFGRDPRALAAFDPHHFTEPFRSAVANAVFAPAARWDSVWYLQIAHSGYQSRQLSAFFPLYPLLVRLTAPVFGSQVAAGTAISLVSMGVGLWLVQRLTCLELGVRAASAAVLMLALFPTSLFLSAVYSDALCLALSAGAVYAARQERWGWAGGLGGLAALTRSTGALIAVPLVMLYLSGRDRRARSRARSSAAWLVLVPVGVLAYLAYHAAIHHGALAPFQSQKLWAREFTGPLGAVLHAAAALPGDVQRLVSGSGRPTGAWDPLSWDAHDLIDLGFLAFAAGGLWFAWRRMPRAYSIYALLLVGQSLSAPTPNEPLESFSRYLLGAFPLFMAWGAVLAEHARARTAVLAGSGALLAAFSGLWAIWGWIA
jgi:hypothetical protein